MNLRNNLSFRKNKFNSELKKITWPSLKEDGIRFIDLGAFMLAPEQFQPASFFMASLLLEELEDFNLENILSCWKETISREDIILLMGARALMGGAFFQSRSNKSKEDTKLY